MKLKPFSVSYPVPKGLDIKTCYPFEVDCLRSTTWESDPDTLFIIGFVDSGDIRNGQLLTSSPAKEVFQILVESSIEYYNRVTGNNARMPNMAVINFNYHRNMHLKGTQLEVSLSAAAKRARKLIDKLKPKKIVCFGRDAAAWILDSPESGAHFGMVKQYKSADHDCILIPVPSFHNTIMRLDEDAADEDYDEAITHANLIGHISRCMSTMVEGRMLFTADVIPAYRYLETYDELDEYLTTLEGRTKPIALDIETNSLASYGTKLSTIQFATSSKEAVMLAINHKDSPFSLSDRKLVMRRLRKFFGRLNPKTYFIGQNLAYDFRILRNVLRLPVIHWMAWDTMGGEHVLDENLRDLDSRLPGENKSRNYALDKIALRYGIPWYTSAAFGKSKRHLIHEATLDNEISEYMAMDVQTTFAIHGLQHKVAAATPHEGGNYLQTFHNYVLYVLGNCTTHTISTMEHRGIQISKKMFEHLVGPESKIDKRIREIEDEFYALESVQKANRMILDEMGAPSFGLFGDVNDWVFKINKEAHIQLLFLDVLGIDDYDEKKSGGAKVGKDFQSKHRGQHKEVELYGEYKKHKAIKSTYIVGWWKKLDAHSDSAQDFRIRPGYSYLLVTGRSNSFNPNLQNVPEHHSSAKFVKEPMKAPIGYIKADADYSSHEVRCWGIASRDPNLANTFKLSLQLIYELRMHQTAEAYLRFKYESDTHKINYAGFTGIEVKDVTKEQRQAAKGIVFGSMYGIGDPSLAKSINKSLDETRDIKGKFFKRYAKGAKWMADQCKSAIENNYVVSMLGRRRNLIGHRIPVPTLQAAFERRAQNSPIQGVASDFGYIAARLYTQAIDSFCKKFDIPSNKDYLTDHGWEDQMSSFDTNSAFAPAGIDSMVHDSIKSQVRYDMIFVAIYLKEWAMTTGVRDYVQKYLGVKFIVDLGIEIEVGADGSSMEAWQWVSKDLEVTEEVDGEDKTTVILGLETLVRNTLNAQKEYGYDIDVKELMKESKTLFKRAKTYLEEKHPLCYHKFRDHGVVN